MDNGESLKSDASTIVLGDFIPFYFGIRMPMLYVMQQGGNFVKKATPPEKIVYLACSINKIIQSDVCYYFTDGHATDNLTSFFDETKIDELPELIDWEAVKSPFWGGHENLNLKRKKQAEFLVSNDLLSEHLYGFGCYNQSAEEELIAMGIEPEKIKMIPGAYY